MAPDFARWIGFGFACIGLASTVAYYIFKAKELRALREIRDRLPRQDKQE